MKIYIKNKGTLQKEDIDETTEKNARSMARKANVKLLHPLVLFTCHTLLLNVVKSCARTVNISRMP